MFLFLNQCLTFCVLLAECADWLVMQEIYIFDRDLLRCVEPPTQVLELDVPQRAVRIPLYHFSSLFSAFLFYLFSCLSLYFLSCSVLSRAIIRS